MVRRPDGGVNLRLDDGIRDQDAALFTVIGAQTGGEHAVGLFVCQGLQGVLRIPEGLGGKVELRVLFTGSRESQKVRQRSGEGLCLPVILTEGKIMIPVSYPDGSMVFIPLQLVRRKKTQNRLAALILFRQLLVEVAVVLHDPVHGDVKFTLDVRTSLVDSKV